MQMHFDFHLVERIVPLIPILITNFIILVNPDRPERVFVTLVVDPDVPPEMNQFPHQELEPTQNLEIN